MINIIFLFNFFINTNNLISCEEYLSNVNQFTASSEFEDEEYLSTDFDEFVNKKKLYSKVDFKDYDQHFLNAALFYLTNDYRMKKRKSIFRFEKRLRNASFIHAYEMMSKGFFDHNNPVSKDLRTPKDRCKFCNYTSKSQAENIERITLGIETNITYLQLAQKILLNFTNSEQHRSYILSPEYNEYGCTVIISEKIFKGGERDFYAVQEFGNPTTESLDLEK